MAKLYVQKNNKKVKLIDEYEINRALNKKENKIKIVENVHDITEDGIYFIDDGIENKYSITLSSDHDIIESGDVATITALFKRNNTPLANKKLLFDGTTTVTTDTNGEAEYEYTGTGIGQKNIPVSFRNLLQETYEFIDADYLDRATSSDHNDNGWNTTTLFTRNTNSTNLYEDRTDSSSARYVRPLSALGLSVEEQDYCVEVTIPSGEVNKFQIRRQNDNGSGSAANIQYLSLTTEYTAPIHIKAIMSKDLFQVFVDDSTEPVLSSTATRTHFNCGFSLNGGTISNVDFKDLVIYKI